MAGVAEDDDLCGGIDHAEEGLRKNRLAGALEDGRKAVVDLGEDVRGGLGAFAEFTDEPAET